jgi:peptidoglycan/LPS O-acetylase OafA/YrhL
MSILDLISIFCYFCLLGICFYLGNILSFILPKGFDDEIKNQEFKQITGLRGFLALSVFLHHAIHSGFVFNYSFDFGPWRLLNSNFFNLIGQLSVALFFSITGFLFWRKAITTGGKINYIQLMVSRSKRILPAYLFACLCLLIIIAFQSHATLNVSLLDLSKQIFLFITSFGSAQPGVVNNFSHVNIGSGAFWTLRYEWKFYMLLPLIALFLKNKTAFKVFLFALGAYVVFRIFRNFNLVPHSLFFLPGMISAHLYTNKHTHTILKNMNYLPHIFALSLFLIFTTCNSAFSYPCLLFMTLIFIVIPFIKPSSFIFKILTVRSVLIAGTVSYSTYILHSMVLALGYLGLIHYDLMSSFSDVYFLFFVFLSSLALVIISLLSYRYIEYPFIRKIKVRN